jgi:hypothetical protein
METLVAKEDEWSEIIPEENQHLQEESAESADLLSKGALIEKTAALIQDAMNDVYSGAFDSSKADGIAALTLSCQMDLAHFLPDAEWRAKQAKHEAKQVAAEAHARYRSLPAEKKITDAILTQLVVKDSDVKAAEAKQILFERDYSKYQHYFDILTNAHIFFRGFRKNNF